MKCEQIHKVQWSIQHSKTYGTNRSENKWTDKEIWKQDDLHLAACFIKRTTTKRQQRQQPQQQQSQQPQPRQQRQQQQQRQQRQESRQGQQRQQRQQLQQRKQQP